MLKMNISNVVNAIVRQDLQGKGRNDEALHFHFRLDMAYYLGDNSGREYRSGRGLHLLYHSRSGSHISAFSSVMTSAFAGKEKVDNWRHEITHDSEWSNINIFSTTYFTMAEEINKQLESDNRGPVAPVEMSEYNNFRDISRLYQWVKVEVQVDPKDEYGHRRLIKLL